MQIDRDTELVDNFAHVHSLCWRISDEFEPVILAPNGFIYAYDQKLMGVSFYPDELPGVDSWNETCQACLRAGMTIIADRICQSYLSFDPSSKAQSNLAIRVCSAKPSPMTVEERDHLKTYLARMRERRALAERRALQRERDWRWKMMFDSIEV